MTGGAPRPVEDEALLRRGDERRLWAMGLWSADGAGQGRRYWARQWPCRLLTTACAGAW
jgi:hypothetical protein